MTAGDGGGDKEMTFHGAPPEFAVLIMQALGGDEAAEGLKQAMVKAGLLNQGAPSPSISSALDQARATGLNTAGATHSSAHTDASAPVVAGVNKGGPVQKC